MWCIVFPNYTQLEPSPYVDDSEKVDAVFQFAHTNGLHIARAIPELNNVPEAAIKLFIENIRNALVSSGHFEDIPPPMDSPGSDDSPQGDAIQDTMFEVAQPASVKDQPAEEEKEMLMQNLSNLSTRDQMSGNTPDLMFNMPLDFSYLQPNADGWYDFGDEYDTAAFQPPGKAGGCEETAFLHQGNDISSLSSTWGLTSRTPDGSRDEMNIRDCSSCHGTRSFLPKSETCMVMS